VWNCAERGEAVREGMKDPIETRQKKRDSLVASLETSLEERRKKKREGKSDAIIIRQKEKGERGENGDNVKPLGGEEEVSWGERATMTSVLGLSEGSVLRTAKGTRNVVHPGWTQWTGKGTGQSAPERRNP